VSVGASRLQRATEHDKQKETAQTKKTDQEPVRSFFIKPNIQAIMSDIPVTPKKLKQIVNDIVPSQQYTEEMQRRQAIDEFNTLVAGQIADYKALIVAAGFSVVPFERELGWRPDEDPDLMQFYPAQELTALQIFYKMFVIEDKKAWVHLSAEMQSGKTGVINTLIRLIKANPKGCQIPEHSIFVTTGMSDTAWVKQTMERLIWEVRENIKHSGTLKKIGATLKELYKRISRDGSIKNILIVVDESHIASAKNNRPFKEVFDLVNRLCGGLFMENNIKFLTVSATDPAAVIAAYKVKRGASSVYLMSSPEYLSVQKLYELGRIMAAKDLANETHMQEFCTFIKSNPQLHKKYIIIRANGSSKGVDRSSSIKRHIEKQFAEFSPIITDWDSKSPRPDRIKETDGTSTSTKMEDINELLSEEPSTLHFIMIKNMFYAAKTMDTSHVGILYDSYSQFQKHDTALQSFLGRACGYNKNSDVYIFGNIEAVETYIEVWRDIESKLVETPGGNIIIDGVDGDGISGKMTGLGTKKIDGEVAAKLEESRAVPLSHLIDPATLSPVDGRMTVPIVIPFDQEFIQELIASDRRGALLIERLRVKYKKLRPYIPNLQWIYETITTYALIQTTVPKSVNSYKKHIEDPVRNAENNKPFSVDVHEEHRAIDNWQLFIDDRENRVVITIWHGTKSAH
jgi:hypothetical protein